MITQNAKVSDGFINTSQRSAETPTESRCKYIHSHAIAHRNKLTQMCSWGPSAGAISVGLQMVTNKGDTEGLFRGAIMSSGSPLPSGDITNLQPTYDTIVEHAGCANSSDTLECLRQVPVDTLLAAAETLPSLFGYPVCCIRGGLIYLQGELKIGVQGLATPWAPRADGVFLEDPPQHLVLSGSVADVPFITGSSRVSHRPAVADMFLRRLP